MKPSLLITVVLVAVAVGACGESSPPAQKASTTPPVQKGPEIAKPTEAAPAPPPPPAAPAADMKKEEQKVEKK